MTHGESVSRGRNLSAVGLVLLALVLLGILMWMLLSQGSASIPAPGSSKSLVPVRVIRGPGVGDAPEFRRPLGVSWSPRGDIYVSDTGNRRIAVFTGGGRFLREFGRITTQTPISERPGALQQPAGLAVSDEGHVFVADLRAGVVKEYDRRGAFQRDLKPSARVIGSERWQPIDVAATGSRIYVADGIGVTVFSLEGKVEERFTQATGKRSFARPGGVAVGLDGSVYVTDSLGRRIVALAPDGTPSWVLPASLKNEDEVFGLPRGIGVAPDGTIFVVDGFKFNLTHVSRTGEQLAVYGQRGDAAGFFSYPNDVSVRGDMAIVADKENNRVQLLRLQGIIDTDAIPDR